MVRNALSENVSFGHVQNRKDRDRTVSYVFGLEISGLVASDRQGWRDAFECLEPRAFVQAKQILI